MTDGEARAPAWDRSRPWCEYPIVFLDAETTGTEETDRIVELAAARLEWRDGQWAIETRVALVNPGLNIPPELTEIHGITDAMVADAPPFGEVWPAFEAGLFRTGDEIAAAYNAPFDRKMIRAEHLRAFEAAPRPVPAGMRYQWLDPFPLVQKIDRFVSGRGRHKLAVTCERWGIPLDGAHRAEDDCIAGAKLLTSTRMRREIALLCYMREHGQRPRCAAQDVPTPSLRLVQDLLPVLYDEAAEQHRRFKESKAGDRGKVVRCKSCPASIRWIETDKGNPMPLDAEPTPAGNVVLDETGKRGTVAAGEELERFRGLGAVLYMPHHAVCPAAAKHRTPSR